MLPTFLITLCCTNNQMIQPPLKHKIIFQKFPIGQGNIKVELNHKLILIYKIEEKFKLFQRQNYYTWKKNIWEIKI